MLSRFPRVPGKVRKVQPAALRQKRQLKPRPDIISPAGTWVVPNPCLISTSTDRSDEGVNCVFDAFHGFAVCLYESVERGVIRGNGARNRGDIDSHPAMQQAYEMGKNV